MKLYTFKYTCADTQIQKTQYMLSQCCTIYLSPGVQTTPV